MSDQRPAPSPLVHNMSVPPRSQISHRGVFAGGRALVATLDALGNGCPPGVRLGTAALADWLGVELEGGSQRAERKLRRLVRAHVETLALPPACVVTHEPPDGIEQMTDRLGIVAVLAKSSGSVYLRDKEPNFDRLVPGARVILIIPQSWSPQ
ncbi:MAG: hypothetical protein HUU14_12385 [Dehalococcoidia bacterium]|nr:hypothetical protein [Dehalococcoidia bacterium]NUQ56678.1 hypothetical protein [Dehalococcoidia bacterium]RIL02081.1 MAG: hypothetical protein DCC78_08385 [bacterium]